jgi:hypothetical protein
MKKLFFVLTLLMTLVLGSQAETRVPAFPGAEGHGRYVTGGRGGKVVHVTNLNDSGTGSFRAAVSGAEKKIVVFDVGGVIPLASDLTIGANTTVLGQTAPAPGITLRYYTLQYGGDNIVVRFIRSRRGQEKDVNDGADATWTRHHTGIILDHCSFSWSIDEVASFYDNNNFTMQWCTIGEALHNAGHGKGAHGYGGIWGGKLASFHHNLICHTGNRTPRFNGARYNWTGYTNNKLYSEYRWANAVQAENVDFRNCVIYNCGNGCYGGPGGGQINMVNNYYKSGPAGSTSYITQASVANSGSAEGYEIYWTMFSRYYIDGNRLNSTNNADWSYVRGDKGYYSTGGVWYTPDPNHYYGDNVSYITHSGTDYVSMRLSSPAPTGEVTTHTAVEAYNKVLGLAGASLDPDEVDLRYFEEALAGTATYTGSVTGKKGRIDLVSDVDGYTEKNFGTGKRPTGFDTDGDGMPDAWETANGLNPNDSSDGSAYTLDTVKFYSNLEVYANSLVQDIMLDGNDDAVDPAKEYYPAYTKADGTHVDAINTLGVTSGGGDAAATVYTLAQSTNNASGNTSSSYAFNDGFTITNSNSKSYATGKEDGIKFSAGVKYTINIPAALKVTKMVIRGYDNYADVDSYLAELNGVSYEATTYVWPMKNGSNYVMASHTIEFDSPIASTITFTPQGKQVVWAFDLTCISSTVGIESVVQKEADNKRNFNLLGQPVSSDYKGLVIRNGKLILVK